MLETESYKSSKKSELFDQLLTSIDPGQVLNLADVKVDYEPRPVQVILHEAFESHRWALVVAHRRLGKTVAVINHLIKLAARCERERGHFAYVSPYWSQSKDIAWNYLKHYAGAFPGLKINESELYVELPNQARVRLFGADNPDRLRGLYFDCAAIDEVAQMRPEVWGEIIRPALADREGSAIFIGTPKGINIFYELYLYALKDPAWYCEMFPVTKTDVLSETEIEESKKQMSDAQFRQEFLCDFKASSTDVFIPIDLALGAADRELSPKAYAHAAKVMGVDSARFGDDRSVIVVRQGAKVLTVEKYHGLDVMELVDKVATAKRKEEPQTVFVESTGSDLATGLIDRLRQLGHKIVEVNPGKNAENKDKYANKRAEMWAKMKEWLPIGDIPNDMEIISDLTTLTHKLDGRDRLQLEAKAQIKGRGMFSPDCADALAMTFAYPVQIQADRSYYKELQAKSREYGDFGV